MSLLPTTIVVQVIEQPIAVTSGTIITIVSGVGSDMLSEAGITEVSLNDNGEFFLTKGGNTYRFTGAIQ